MRGTSAERQVLFGLVLSLWVTAASAQTVSSLSCSPTVIQGGSGGTSSCTVTLSTAAPSGGTAVSLTSSLLELAASLPTVTVPAAQTTANFVVATNPGYRRYSGLAFNATITASANGTSRSATISVTAQPRPADFDSGSTSNQNTQWEGLMCGSLAPIGGYPDILYDCSRAEDEPDGFGRCTFFQECPIGCRRVPPNREKFEDFCATTGPNPVSVSRNSIVGGDRITANIVSEAPAGSGEFLEQGVLRLINPNFNSAGFPQNQIGFPRGSTSVTFEIATSYVPAIEFVEVGGYWFNDAIPPLLITSGRAGHVWLVVLPTENPPAVALPTLGNFRITGLDPVTGGESTFGQVDLSGLSRAGGPTITLTSSHPDIVPNKTVDAPANENLFGFQVNIETNPPTVDTDVTITASDGRYSFSDVLTVRVPPPPPVLSDLTVNPTSVVGGNPSTGTVFLSSPQSEAKVVSLSTPAPPSVATIPDSVTVPAGDTSATFPITTNPVAETFNMNIFADLAGSPSQQTLLLINPGAPLISSLSLNPTSVVGGNSSTGTVTLTAAAPAGGSVVSLSSNSTAATVPPSVTVPEGATSNTFNVTTTDVTNSTIATITGRTGDTSRSADLTVNPTNPPPAFRSPTANSRDSGGDGNGFEQNPSNAHADDAANASDLDSGTGTGTSCTSTGKDRHRFLNFGFSIPTDASINGIEVRLDARADSTADSPLMCVQLSWDGGTTWTAAKATTILATTMNTFTLGSGTDTWGRAWTPANFTNANFRVRIITVSSSTARDFFLDWVAARVYQGPAAPAALSAISVNPSSVTGGNSSTGTATLTSAAPVGGAVVSLASSNTAAATVPASVTVPEGQTSANFNISTQTVSANTDVSISGTYKDVTRSSTLTVTPQSSDTVTVERAEYKDQDDQLRVEATSTSSTATLKVHVTSTNELIGTLNNNGGGRYGGTFNWPSNPQNVTVRSSQGGSASRDVTVN